MRKRIQLAARHKLGAAAAVAVTLIAVAAPAVAPAAHAATEQSATVAVSQIQNLNNTVRGETSTYGGLWIDDKTNTVYVSTTKASVSAATVAAMEPRAAAPATPAMKLVVVHAKYDFAQLQAFAARVKNDKRLQNAAKASHALLSEWYPDPLTDKIVIGFTKVTAAERAAVTAQFAATARVITAPIAYSAVGKPASAKTSPRTIRPQSRTVDLAPWYGGDVINGPDGSCTSGFDWSGNSMTTAGHCGDGTFTNNGVEVGKTYTIQWGDNRIDMQRLTGSSYLPYIWAGSNGQESEPVSGSGGVALGGTYCTGGAVTLKNCTAVVDQIDVCVYIASTNNALTYVCYLDHANSSNSTKIVQSGDSGGPVYTSNSANAPYAVGTISASANSSKSGYWSDMYEEKVIFGGAPEVGT